MIPSWPWWIWVVIGLVGLLFIILEGAYRLVSQKEDERKAMEERAIKAEEKLTTKIILTLQDCLFSDGYLFMKLAICNDGYKILTLKSVIIITADKKHLLMIQQNTASLDNNYNNILNTESISEITDKPLPEYEGVTYEPDATDEMTIKQSFNLEEYLKEKNMENIKKMPLGIIIGITDYKGLLHPVTYYPCCEINIREDGGIGIQINHKPFEKILREGETNIVKSWREGGHGCD